jgi:hypothetical protein
MMQELPDLKTPRWRPWREISILALIVMELSWIVPWYRSLTSSTYATSPPRVFLVLAGLTLSTHLIVRLMNYLYLRIDIRRFILAGIFVSAVFISFKALLYTGERITIPDLINRPLEAFSGWSEIIPDEFLVALVALLACWRGLALAQMYIEPNTVRLSFQTGIFMFLAFVFINTIVTGETPGDLIYLFLSAGLIALGAARISVVSTLRGGTVNPFDRRWFVGMIVATLSVVGVAALVSGLLSQGGITNLGSILLGLFALLMVALMSPVIFAMQFLFSNTSGVSNFAQEVTRSLVEVRSTLFAYAERIFVFLDGYGVFEWAPRLKPVLLWSILFVVGLVIVFGISRWLLNEKRERVEERESLIEGGSWLTLLLQALQNQLQKISDGLIDATRLRTSQRLLAAARIRRIYAQLMDLSEDLGKPRNPAKTPLEFLPALNELFPTLENELSKITNAYMQVRYGELPETRQEVEDVEKAWAFLQAQGLNQLKQKKNTG